MSTAYNRRKKARKAARSVEEKEIDQKIKNGKYPRFFVKGLAPRIVRVKHPRYLNATQLSWRLQGTKAYLLKGNG